MIRVLVLFCFVVIGVIPPLSLSQNVEESALTSAGSYSDNESGIDTDLAVAELATVQIENLAILAKVWGFLKYHHPRIVAGEFDWDKDLLQILPVLLKAKDFDSRNAILFDWATQLGTPEPCDPCAVSAENVHLQPRLDWIYDRSELGAKLSDFLSTVYVRRLMGAGQHYVGAYGSPTYGTFSNESDYENIAEIGVGLRLLALFRYWNVIEYWFPYYDLIGEPWQGVLREFIPRCVFHGCRSLSPHDGGRSFHAMPVTRTT